MTPAEHAKAIEDAAKRYAEVRAIERKDGVKLKASSVTLKSLKAAIRSAVGAAPPKDSAEFALAALVAAGHVSQSKVDYARALMPEGGYVAKAAPEGWQLVQSTGSTQKCSCAACDKAANHGMRTHMSVCPRCGSKRCEKALNHQAECSSAPKP